MITQTEIGGPALHRAFDYLLRQWQSGPLHRPLERAGFGAFLLSLCLLSVLFGPIVQYEYAHDSFIFLDGGWRVLHGQRPQVDFSTNLGPLIFLFTAAGIAVMKQGGHALVLAQALLGLMVAALVYPLSVRRLPRVPAVALSTVIVLLALAPYNVGEFPFLLTYGMIYNRIGYALLGVLLIEATRAAQPGPSAKRDEFIGGMLTGFICSFLLFLKITFFVFAVILIVALLRYRPQCRQRFAGMAVTSAAFALLMLGYLRFDLPALFHEYLMSAGGKHMARLGPLGVVMANVEPTIVLVVLGCLWGWLVTIVNRDRFPLSRPWAIFISVLVGYGLIITNHQGGGQPLNAFICVLIAGEIAVSAWPGWKPSFNVPALLLVIGLCAPLIGFAIPTAIAYSLPALEHVIHWAAYSPEMRLAAPAVSDFRSKDTSPRFDRKDDGYQGNYAIFVNDGLALLRKYSPPQESVVSLEFSNPFSFSLQRKPPTGGTTCLQFGVTFDNAHKLSPDQLFGDAQVVMLPKLFSAPLLSDAVARNYVAPLRAKFRKVAESSQWELYRRITD
jgi:hypothetical protein